LEALAVERGEDKCTTVQVFLYCSEFLEVAGDNICRIKKM
jgi:hypothetical protein